MCGIVGYIGTKKAVPVLIQGLHKLEYRGYDSAGLAVFDNGKLNSVRSIGKIEKLVEKIDHSNVSNNGTVGIAHTRWATHGEVTESNTHPHSPCSDDLVIVHNGIIENYNELKEKFLKGHTFNSETDTEVLAHLIEVFFNGNLLEAVQKALHEVRGTYGVAVMHISEPEKIIAARMGSPLVIGIGDNEYFLGSDVSPMIAHTKKVVYLEDGEVAELTKSGFNLYNLKSENISKEPETVEWNQTEAEIQGYPNFMLKEINDQPTVLLNGIRGRFNIEDGSAHLGGLNLTMRQMHRIERVVFLACGTSSHAAMVGKLAFERLAGIVSEVCIASEFRYSDPIINDKTLVFALSQSGETADTLAAIREAKRKGGVVRGIVNVVGSSIARECGSGTYIHAGPELAVASTKAYTNMTAVLILYALEFGRLGRLNLATGQRLLKAMLEIPDKMRLILDQSEAIKKIADKYSIYKNFYFLGRGVNYPVALEGSLKLKEVSYCHSEAYPAGELKHGPIALAGPDFPIMAILTSNQLYEKMVSNIRELTARKTPIIVVANVGNNEPKELSQDIIYVPSTMELLEPLLNTVALQLFAYHMSMALGRDVDRPRNLAKSVTVE